MKRLLRALLRLHLARPWALLGPAIVTAALLALGVTRVERQLDLMSLLPKDHPAVKANLEAGVGQQELIWIVAEGAPQEIVTAELIEAVYGLRCMIIDDPVAHTPLVVPLGRR